MGMQPLANAFLREEDLLKDEPVYPLRLFFCSNCNLVQLGEVVDPKSLFVDYIYFSGSMPSSKHFRNYAEHTIQKFVRSPEDLIVEIGSNDGHLLRVIKEFHPRILGVDPAQNIAAQANANGIPTIADFFSKDLAKKIKAEHGPAQVIIGNNVVAHIPDHESLFSGIKELLAREGAFIFEAPYMLDMFENLAFDTIYHEHYSYLAVRPLRVLLDKYDMEIFQVDVNPVQGHSLRAFVGHKGVRSVDDSVQRWVQKEYSAGMDKLTTYQELARKVLSLKADVLKTLDGLKKQKKRIVAYGASARGNVLLNFYGIGPDIVEFATEELQPKIGLYTPGMHIPIRHVHEARKNYPDYFYFSAWNYREPVFQKEKEFIARGGKFIMPVGDERII